MWDHSGAVIPFSALIIALFVIPGDSLPLLCPIQSEVNLGEYFSWSFMAFGREKLAHIFMDHNGCTGFQGPILFRGEKVSQVRCSSAHDSYFSLKFAHVFLNVELIPFTLSFKHLLE